MPITEKRDSTGTLPGSFAVNLVPNTPLSVLQDIADYPLSYVVITDAHLPGDAVTAADMVASSGYTGQINQMGANLLTLEGHSLAVLLGDPDGKADTAEGADFESASYDIEAHFDNYIDGKANGLTKGDISTLSATYTYEIKTGDTRRDILYAICEMRPIAKHEFRVSHAGAINVGYGNYPGMFSQDQVVFTRDPGGRAGNIVGLQAQITVSDLDWSDLTSKVVVDWNSGVSLQTASNTLTNTVGFAGAALVVERPVSNRPTRPAPQDRRRRAAWASSSANNALRLATSVAGDYADARQQIEISLDEYAPWRFFIPGDTVYVWDPLTDIYDATNQITYRGESIFPEEVRVFGWTTPVQEGYGVYHHRSDGAGGMELVDLTEWVNWETGTTKLEIGALRRSLTG